MEGQRGAGEASWEVAGEGARERRERELVLEPRGLRVGRLLDKADFALKG